MSTIAADRGGTGPERHEHDGEADEERDARDDDPTRNSALAEPVRLDRRHRREVAGHERQHARGDHGDEAGKKGDRNPLCHGLGSRRVQPRELVVDAPVERRVERRCFVGGSRLTLAAPTHCEHGEDPRSGDYEDGRQHPRQEVEPPLGRRGEHLLAEVVDELRLDLRLRVAGRDPGADERPHAVGHRGRRLIQGRMARGADDLALDLGERRLRLARESGSGQREREKADGEATPHHGESAERIPASSASLSISPSTAESSLPPGRMK